MAAEYAVDGILVNTVCLEVVKSMQWERWATGDREAHYREVARRVPLGRVAEAEEFAGMSAVV